MNRRCRASCVGFNSSLIRRSNHVCSQKYSPDVRSTDVDNGSAYSADEESLKPIGRAKLYVAEFGFVKVHAVGLQSSFADDSVIRFACNFHRETCGRFRLGRSGADEYSK